MNNLDEIQESVEKEVSRLDRPTSRSDRVKALLNLTNIAKEHHNHMHEIVSDISSFIRSIRMMLVHPQSAYLRAAATRLCRHMCSNRDITRQLWLHHCDYFLTKLLEREGRKGAHDKERDQALLFVEALIGTHDVELLRGLPRGLINGVVVIAEFPDDRMRKSCIKVLRDLVLFNPRVVAACNGVPVLINAILDPDCRDLVDGIVHVLMYLLDNPETRSYIQHNEIGALFAPFIETDPLDDAKLRAYKWKMAREAITSLTQSWSGLLALSPFLSPLAQSLLLDSSTEQTRALFDLFTSILRSTCPSMLRSAIPSIRSVSSSDISGDDTLTAPSEHRRRSGSGRRSGGHGRTLSGSLSPTGPGSGDNASTSASVSASASAANDKTRGTNYVGMVTTLDNRTLQGDNVHKTYLAVVLVSLLHAGLPRVLVRLTDSTDWEVSVRASEMLHVFLVFSDAFVPSSHTLRLHDLLDDRVSGSLNESGKEPLSRTNAMLTNLHVQQFRVHPRKNRMQSVKITIDSGIDSEAFSQLLKDTRVLDNRQYTRWDWDAIWTVVAGPLRVPARLHEALRTNFCKRLMHFYRPKKKEFSELRKNLEHETHARVGCQFLEVLLISTHGRKFLVKSKFLRDMCNALQVELDSKPGESPYQCFSVNNVTFTMSREYFKMLGILSQSPVGIELLQQHGILDALYQLMSSKLQRDYICELIVKNMNYSSSIEAVSKPMRTILGKAMTDGTSKLRHTSTLQLRDLFRKGRAGDFSEWGVALLKGQLHDDNADVVKAAMYLLEEACIDNDANLRSLIKLRPPVAQLERFAGGVRSILALRFLSQKEGLAHLQEEGWLDPEMARWHTEEAVAYARTVEEALKDSVTTNVQRRATLALTVVSEEGVCVPPHFYGELAKTEQGCDIIRKHGHLEEFLRRAKDIHGASHRSPEESEHRRASLWALGQIGASETGFALLDEHQGLNVLLELAETEEYLSYRGLVMMAIGLICKVPAAQEQLKRRGWTWRIDDAQRVAVAVPERLEQFMSIEGWSLPSSASIKTSTSFANKFNSHHSNNHNSNNHNSNNHNYINSSNHSHQMMTSVGSTDLYTVPEQDLPDLKDGDHQRILDNVALLTNPVSKDQASRTLKRMRQANMDNFCTPQVVFRVYELLSRFKYRLQLRRFIYELFDGCVLMPADFAFFDHRYSEHIRYSMPSSETDGLEEDDVV